MHDTEAVATDTMSALPLRPICLWGQFACLGKEAALIEAKVALTNDLITDKT